jgi:hypothetical protein
MMGDVQVVGLVPETVQLPDIGLDVAHGVAVWIPGEKATASKDLWRAISQRRVFKLSSSSPIVAPHVRPPTEEIAQLKARIATLEKENAELHQTLAQQAKIEDVLNLLRSGQIPMFSAPSKVGPSTGVPAPGRPAVAVVEVDTPTFIPSQIRSDSQEARVTVSEGQTEGGSVTDARSALRKIRKGE